MTYSSVVPHSRLINDHPNSLFYRHSPDPIAFLPGCSSTPLIIQHHLQVNNVSPLRRPKESHVRGSLRGPETEANLHRMGQRCLRQPVRELDAMDRGQIPGLVRDRQQSLLRNQRCLLAFYSPSTSLLPFTTIFARKLALTPLLYRHARQKQNHGNLTSRQSPRRREQPGEQPGGKRRAARSCRERRVEGRDQSRRAWWER